MVQWSMMHTSRQSTSYKLLITPAPSRTAPEAPTVATAQNHIRPVNQVGLGMATEASGSLNPIAFATSASDRILEIH